MLSYWHTLETYIYVNLETLLQRICSKREKLDTCNSVCKNGGEGRIKQDLSCSQAWKSSLLLQQWEIKLTEINYFP